MRRTLTALLAAAILTAAAVMPVAAKGNTTKPYFELGMCRIGADNTFLVNSYWGNQGNTTANLTITINFKGSGLPTSGHTFSVLGPVGDTSLYSEYVPPFLGHPNWDDWTSVSATASGAFTQTAQAIRQPKGGWGTCAGS